MTREDAFRIANDWNAAWNARDVERVLAHVDNGVSFTSPTALAVVGMATVNGKAALREYWGKALSQITGLRFTMDRIVWDEHTRELAIIYQAEINGHRKMVSENLVFGSHGLIVRAEVFHGAGI